MTPDSHAHCHTQCATPRRTLDTVLDEIVPFRYITKHFGGFATFSLGYDPSLLSPFSFYLLSSCNDCLYTTLLSNFSDKKK